MVDEVGLAGYLRRGPDRSEAIQFARSKKNKQFWQSLVIPKS